MRTLFNLILSVSWFLPAATLTVWLTPTAWARPEEPPRVKTSRTGVSGEQYVEGVVDLIDKDGMTLVEVLKTGEVREHKLVPTDVLRGGEVRDHITGRFTGLWADVKRGDRLEVVSNTDRIDKLTYCVQICVLRRPKGKLPAWQRVEPGYDEQVFARLQMFNDLDNGEDVRDEDIKTLFPSRPEKKDYAGRVTPAVPGGLPKEWQEKLDAIRAKKAKEKDDPKAKPPEKPAEKK